MAQNLESESQVREMLENVQTYSRERLDCRCLQVWMRREEPSTGSAAGKF